MVTELGFAPAVRELELHCRKGWGNDFWQAAADDVVLEIRTLDPDAEPGATPVATGASAVDLERDDDAPVLELDGHDRVISLEMAADR
jgi:hypothetical protein